MQAEKNTYQLYTYSPPLFPLLALSFVVFIIKRLFPFFRIIANPPQRVGAYVLVKSIQDGSDGYACGIYMDGNQKKVIIKTWSGRIKDLRYFHLMREFFITKHLYRKLSMLAKVRVRVPKPLVCYRSSQSLSIVYEYIEGRSLSTLSAEEQSSAVLRISYDLTSASRYIGADAAELFASRGQMYYILRTPFLLFYRLFTRPKQIFEVMGISSVFVHFGWLFSSQAPLTLAHRKLVLENVLVCGNSYYLLSCGSMVFTLPFYDIHTLVLSVGAEHLMQILQGNLNQFLLSYLILYDMPRFQRESYSSSLKSSSTASAGIRVQT